MRPRRAHASVPGARHATVGLDWIPLGAGGHCVRFNGRLFEAFVAVCERHPRNDLYDAALVIAVDDKSYTIELAPAFFGKRLNRGVVSTGAVESRLLGWSPLFRAYPGAPTVRSGPDEATSRFHAPTTRTSGADHCFFGKGAVLAHRLARPLAAESDDSQES